MVGTIIGTCRLEELLGDGSWLGISFSYKAQPRPEGLPQAYILGKDFIQGRPCCLMLGDNIFYGAGLPSLLRQAGAFTEGAVVLAQRVNEVSTALSGMNSTAQLRENLRIAEEGRANSLSTKELALIDHATETYKKMFPIDCTACSYCLPCPQGVNIPHNFRLYNDLHVFPDQEINFLLYNQMTSPEQRASNCSECGECEERYPQQIKIAEELKKVHSALSRERPK